MAAILYENKQTCYELVIREKTGWHSRNLFLDALRFGFFFLWLLLSKYLAKKGYAIDIETRRSDLHINTFHSSVVFCCIAGCQQDFLVV